jgi:hypothetical protein
VGVELLGDPRPPPGRAVPLSAGRAARGSSVSAGGR